MGPLKRNVTTRGSGNAASPSTRRTRLVLWTLVEVAVGGALVWAAVQLWREPRLHLALRRIPVFVVAAYGAGMGLARLVNAVRWHRICMALGLDPPGVLELWRMTLAGEFVNLFVPSFLAGEVVRGAQLGARSHMAGSVATSVLLDRGTGLMGAFAGAVVSLVLVRDRLGALWGHLPPWVMTAWPWILVAVALAGALVLAWWARRRIGPLSGSHQRAAILRALTAAVGCSLLTHALIGAAYVVLLTGTGVTGAGVALAVGLLPRLAGVVPLSVLGIGLVDGGTWAVARQLGVAFEWAAVVLGIQVGTKYAYGMVGGALYLLQRRRVRRVRSQQALHLEDSDAA